MRYIFTSWLAVVFLVVNVWFLKPNFVWAASSDDAVDTNYEHRDPEDYNYLPLVLTPDVSTGGTGALRDTISYNMVYDQGYEVQCAKPDWTISAKVFGAIAEYFKHYSSPVTLNGEATYNMDFSNGRIPLFRGDEALDDTKKNSSYEGYFGANYAKDTPAEINSTGVANLLLSQSGQCAAKYNNLQSLFGDGAICAKLSNSSQCALNRKINGTNFTTQTLYKSLAVLFSKNNGERRLNCRDIVSGWKEDLIEFEITKNQYEKEILPAVNALSIMPLNLDVLYRLAFLVIAPQQNPDTGNDVFSFLQNQSPLPDQTKHNTINEEKHAPIIIGFKIPFTITNSIFSLPKLRDSSLLTADLSRELAHIEELQSDAIGERNQFISTIIANKKTKPVINCDGLPQCTGGSDGQAMYQALVDIINGSELACSGFKGPYENAGDLSSPAEASEEKNFKKPYGTVFLPIANSAGFSWSLVVRNKNVQSEAAGENVPVSAYFITPYGTDLEYLQDSLKGVFFSDTTIAEGELTEWEKLVQNNCILDFNGECGMIPEYFTLGGIIADLDSTSPRFSFEIPNSNCKNGKDCEPITLSFGATLIEEPRELFRILGAQTGWMIKQIQLKLRDFESKAHNYISECVRTEDMFLGRCIGFQGLPGGSDSNIANSCNDYQGIDVKLPSMAELEKLVCRIAKNNANDAQLLWGILQIEGSPILREIRAGTDSMSCGDLISNACGASQIVGILVPACIDKDACPQAAYIADDEQLQQEITPEVACSVEGSLTYILQRRKNEISFLKEEYRKANGREPSTTQLYYMMAGRNYGLSVDLLVKPACEGAPPVQGCNGANYCQCAMDTFKFSCH